MRQGFIISFLLLVMCFSSCSDAPNYPIEPVITYEGISKNQVFQFTNGPVDSVQIRFSFTDGDGDLSQIDSDSIDIFFTDSRLPDLPFFFRFPLIDPEGTGNGISGTATVTLVNSLSGAGICCIFEEVRCAEDPNFPVDEVVYSIQIRDRANNFSNVIETEPIQIICVP
ncbi:MAG: hypothetical protein AAFU67_12445 [Bacteroidota bacterium]